MLRVKGADHNTDEEIEEEECAHDDEDHKEEDPGWRERVTRHVVDGRRAGARLHHTRPPRDRRHREQGHQSVDNIVELINRIGPVSPSVKAVPLGFNDAFKLLQGRIGAREELPFEVTDCDDPEDEIEEHHDDGDVGDVGDGQHERPHRHLELLVLTDDPEDAEYSEDLDGLEVV